MITKIADLVRRRPWLVIGICLALSVGLGLGLLFLEGQVTYQGLLPKDFPSVKAIAALDREFDGISYEYILVRAPDVTDAKIVEKMIGIEDRMAADPRFNKGQIATRKDALRGDLPVVQSYLGPFISVMQREIASRGIDIRLSTISNSMAKAFIGKDFGQLVREDYLSNPQAAAQVEGTFVTPDRKAALIMVKAGANLTEIEQVKLGGDVADFFKQVFASTGATLSISGDATLARDFNNHIKSKTLILFVAALGFVLLTLFVVFRRVSDTFLPIVTMLLGVLWTFGLTGWLGIPYTVAVIAVMPLVLGLALTFVVPFMARYYEEVEKAQKLDTAVARTIVAIGVAIFMAMVTNLAGFLVFGFSVLPALRDFGIVCAIGNLLLFILALTLMPAVIELRDRRSRAEQAAEKVAERLARARMDDEAVGKAAAVECESIEAEGGEDVELKKEECRRRQYFDGLALRKSQGLFVRVTNRILDWFTHVSITHSVALVIVFGVLIVAGFLQITELKTDSDLRKLVPGNLPGIKADFELEKYFGGQQQDVIMVEGDVLSPAAIAAMRKVEDEVTDPKINGGGSDMYTPEGAMSLTDALTAANNGKMPATREEALAALKTAEDNGGYVTGGLLSSDGKAALVTLNARGAQSTEVVDRKIDLLEKASERHLEPVGLQWTLGGITPLTKDMTRKLIPTETWSSTISLVLSALVLIVIFRSFPLGLVTLTVALAGVAAEVGFLRITGWELDIVTSLVSALVIGIGVNFGVLFTYRYKQEFAEGLNAPDAIRATMSNMGRANVIAALTTVAAFVIVMFSGIVPLKRFGGVTAFSISVCLVTSLTLLPALLHRLDLHKSAQPALDTAESAT